MSSKNIQELRTLLNSNNIVNQNISHFSDISVDINDPIEILRNEHLINTCQKNGQPVVSWLFFLTEEIYPEEEDYKKIFTYIAFSKNFTIKLALKMPTLPKINTHLDITNNVCIKFIGNACGSESLQAALSRVEKSKIEIEIKNFTYSQLEKIYNILHLIISLLGFYEIINHTSYALKNYSFDAYDNESSEMKKYIDYSYDLSRNLEIDHILSFSPATTIQLEKINDKISCFHETLLLFLDNKGIKPQSEKLSRAIQNLCYIKTSYKTYEKLKYAGTIRDILSTLYLSGAEQLYESHLRKTFSYHIAETFGKDQGDIEKIKMIFKFVENCRNETTHQGLNIHRIETLCLKKMIEINGIIDDMIQKCSFHFGLSYIEKSIIIFNTYIKRYIIHQITKLSKTYEVEKRDNQ